MSKDKGNKNKKKQKADKDTGKKKAISAYKAESQNEKKGESTLEVFAPKPDDKTGGSHKKKQ